MADASRTPPRLDVPGVLILENSPGEAKKLAELCRRSFGVGTKIEPRIGNASQIIEGFDQILSSVNDGSVAFLDICLETNHRICSGIDVAQHLRERRPDVTIVIYSMRADVAVTVDAVKNDWADEVISKEQINSNTLLPEQFNAVVNRAIQRRRLATLGPISIEPNPTTNPKSDREWLMFELVSRIGVDELGRLLALCVDGATSATLEYLTPGFSGSHVMRAHVQREAAEPITIVLKTSRDKDSLGFDRRHIKDIGRLPGRILPHLREEGIQSGQAGWHAYAMEAVEGSPLADLIGNRGVDLLSTVFERLRPLYDTQSPTMRNPFTRPFFSGPEKAAAVVELKRLAPVLLTRGGLDDKALSSLREFVVNGKLLNREEREIASALGEMPSASQHGDLHMNNIMVDLRGGGVEVCLIDWSRYDVYPLGTDLARLESEFRLRFVDVEDGAECDMNQIASWQKARQRSSWYRDNRCERR